MSRIIIKRASPATAGRAPLAADLSLGELAINPADGMLFTAKDIGGGSKQIIRVGAEVSQVVADAMKQPTGAEFLAALGGGNGALELIEARAASGAEQVFSGLGIYRDIMVVGIGLNTSGAATLQMQVGDSSGFISANVYNHPSAAIGYMFLSDSATATRSFNMTIHNFNKTDAIKPVVTGVARNTYTNWPAGIVAANALDRLRVYASTGTLSAGTIYLLGRRG